MADGGKKVYSMTLPQFDSYLGDKLKELRDSVKQIEEIKVEFEAAFKRELAAWQERFSFCYPLIKADRSVLPPDLRAKLEVIEREEGAKIRGEIADLTARTREARATMDKQMAVAASARQELRSANPDLDRREERYKAQIVKLQDQYAALFEQEDKLGAGAFAWLSRGSELRRLRREQKKVKDEQAKALEKLHEVRAAWVEKIETTSEAQAQLAAQWQDVGVQTARDEARLAFLSSNTSELTEQNALQRLLEELDSAPNVPGELGVKLAELAEHNRIRANYEQGLADVSLSLGLMRGIGTGLEKFRDSLGKVVAEQRKYNLANTQAPVPASVAVINQTWKYLADKVRDEDYMGQNPLAFSEVVAKYVSNRLTDQTIQRFFEEMGAALNRATAAWG